MEKVHLLGCECQMLEYFDWGIGKQGFIAIEYKLSQVWQKFFAPLIISYHSSDKFLSSRREKFP